MKKTLVQNLLAYTAAAALIYYVARGVPLNAIAQGFERANLWLFIPASLLSFLLWFFGETFLFSRLFSYFHRETRFRELLTVNAAQYFLQVINLVVAGGAFVLFLRRRKEVPWLKGSFTMLFQGLVDGLLLAAMMLVAALLAPHSPIRAMLPYATASFLALSWIVVFFLLRPRTRFGLWIYERPSMETFRKARPIHYAKLFVIRTPLFVMQAFTYYFQMLSFHIHVPLAAVLALSPAVIAIGGIPLTPVGMGPLQAVLVKGFQGYAASSELLAMALAISAINIAFRIPLGLGSAGTFAHEVAVTEEARATGSEIDALAEP